MRLLMIYVLFCLTPMLGVLFVELFKKYLRRITNEQNKAYAKLHQKQIHSIYVEERKPFYEDTKKQFSSMMKNRELKRKDIIRFDRLIDEHLGEYRKDYQNRQFKNDAHRIYTKLASEHLDMSDWQELAEFLDQCSVSLDH